jgi:hypothetical protein
MNPIAAVERYLWIALAVGLLVGGVVLVHHLKEVGIATQQAADEKAQAVQVAHVQEVESRAAEVMAAGNTRLAVALAATPVAAGFVLRVCPGPPHLSGNLSADDRPGPASPSPGGLPSGVESNAPVGVDIVPGTEAILARANAKLIYWQTFYAICKNEGACK